MATPTQTDALATFRARGGLLRTKDALELGVHPRTLYALRDQGLLEQVSRGVYRLADLPPLGHPDLVAVAVRAPAATICLVSALAYHEATVEVPHEVHIALPPRTHPPQLSYPPIRAFWFSGAALTEGVETVDIDGVPVRIYNLPKTVVDCFRFRNKLGLDVALDALRRAIQDKHIKPAELLHFARLCRAERIMLPYVEALA